MKRICSIVILLAACGGDSSSTSNPTDAKPPVDTTTNAKLVCNSAALCTTYDIKTFTGTVPAPAGGSVSSGLYRLAYKLIPDNVGETGGYHDGLEALDIRGTSYRHAAFFNDDVGSFTTGGTSITFRASQDCPMGTSGDPSTQMRTYTYTATATELDLFSTVTRSDGTMWQQMSAFKLTSSPSEVCQTVDTTPSTPGDSAQCHVTNCACNFALEGTVQSCT